jgi:hypothetical protein
MPGLNRGQLLPTHDHTLTRVLTRAGVLPKRRGKPAAAGSELEQIAWSAPREVAKRRCKCPAWSVATTAFDDRRFRGSVGMRNPDRHAAASVAYKLEVWQIAHLVSGSSVDHSVEYMGRRERPVATRKFSRW